MTLASILTIIQGVLQFPAQVTALIKILQATPAQQHDQLVAAMQKEADTLKQTGRPTW